MKGGQEITLTQFYRLFRKLQPKDEAQRKAFLQAVLQAMEKDLKENDEPFYYADGLLSS